MTWTGSRPPVAGTCQRCEGELEDGFRYCLVCGTPVRATQAAETSATFVVASTGDEPVPATQIIPVARTGIDALLAGPAQQTVVLDRSPARSTGTGAGPSAGSAAPGDLPPADPPGPHRQPRSSPRSRPWLVLVLVLTLAAAGVGGWYYLRESRRSDQLQALLSQDREIVDTVLLQLSSASTTAEIRAAASPAVDQSREHAAAAAEAASSTEAAELRPMGRALDAVAGLRTLTADTLDSWSSEQPKVASALRAVPALAADTTAIDAALANVASVVRRGQTALADWQQEAADAEQESAGSVSDLDDYALAVRTELDGVRRAQQSGGAALRDSDFGPIRGYQGAASAAEATAADLAAAADGLDDQTRVSEVSWQHDELVHAVTAMSSSVTNLATSFTQASQCRVVNQPTPSASASTSAGATGTDSPQDALAPAGPGATSAPTSSADTGSSAVEIQRVADTPLCDQLARDAWGAYSAAAAEQGPALDSAISSWESRLTERRQELTSISAPAKPEV